MKNILPKLSAYDLPLSSMYDKTAGPLSLAKNFIKGTIGWTAMGAGMGAFADEEGRRKDGILKTFANQLRNPKMWLAGAAGHVGLGAYNKLHKGVMRHLVKKGGKAGKVANFLTNTTAGKILDPTGAYSLTGIGLGIAGIPTPANAVMDLADPDHKIYSGLKGSFWEPNKKYKSVAAADSF